MNKTSTKAIAWILIVIVSLVAGIIGTYATMNGPWGYTDPVVYISSARNLLNGNGIGYFEMNGEFNPLSQYPPFIPLLLAFIGTFHVDLVIAFRWINIVTFMATVFISGWIFLRYTTQPIFGILTSVLMCVFPFMVTMFSSTYSEPVFIFLIMAGGVLVFEYLRTEKDLYLFLGALLIGLVPLTRYIGVSILASTSLFILFFTRGSIKMRLWKATRFGVLASIPILVWLCHTYGMPGSSIGRWSVNPNMVDISGKFQEFRALFMDAICRWLPDQFQATINSVRYATRYLILGIGALVFVAISLTADHLLRHTPNHKRSDSGFLILIYFGISATTFLVFLIISFIFSHPNVAIDNRMLLPFFVLSIMCLFAGIALWQFTVPKDRIPWLQIISFLLVAIYAYWMIPETREAAELYHSGMGLTADKWRASQMILAVRSLPDDQPVISNDWELLQLWTGRPVSGFWNTLSGVPGQPSFCKKGAVLVLFPDFQEQLEEIFETESSQTLKNSIAALPVRGEYSDGMIYACP